MSFTSRVEEESSGTSWCPMTTIEKTCWSKDRHVTPSALQVVKTFKLRWFLANDVGANVEIVLFFCVEVFIGWNKSNLQWDTLFMTSDWEQFDTIVFADLLNVT